jgi:hypothetical protein
LHLSFSFVRAPFAASKTTATPPTPAPRTLWRAENKHALKKKKEESERERQQVKREQASGSKTSTCFLPPCHSNEGHKSFRGWGGDTTNEVHTQQNKKRAIIFYVFFLLVFLLSVVFGVDGAAHLLGVQFGERRCDGEAEHGG